MPRKKKQSEIKLMLENIAKQLPVIREGAGEALATNEKIRKPKTTHLHLKKINLG